METVETSFYVPPIALCIYAFLSHIWFCRLDSLWYEANVVWYPYLYVCKYWLEVVLGDNPQSNNDFAKTVFLLLDFGCSKKLKYELNLIHKPE